jgi:hypothetical protein
MCSPAEKEQLSRDPNLRVTMPPDDTTKVNFDVECPLLLVLNLCRLSGKAKDPRMMSFMLV